MVPVLGLELCVSARLSPGDPAPVTWLFRAWWRQAEPEQTEAQSCPQGVWRPASPGVPPVCPAPRGSGEGGA